MAQNVIVYKGQTVALNLCEGQQLHVRSAGLQSVNITGKPGTNCSACDYEPLAINVTATRTFAVSVLTDPCNSFSLDSSYFLGANPPGWVNGGPPVNCISNCSTNHVFGGTKVTNPVDFMASIQIPAGSHVCGGTLIAPNVVLTASHCTVEFDSLSAQRGQVSVLTGSLNYGAGVDGAPLPARAHRFDAVQWVSHPSFNLTDFSHDVALVLLSGHVGNDTELSLGEWSAKPVSSVVPVGAQLSILGWGVDCTGCGLAQGESLRNATLPFVPLSMCRAEAAQDLLQNGDYMPVTDDSVCAGIPHVTDTCSGDSGGPLLVMGGDTGTDFGPQVGVTSHGTASCGGLANVVVGAYASTSDPTNLHFILQQLNTWGSSAPHVAGSPPPLPPVSVQGGGDTPSSPAPASSSSGSVPIAAIGGGVAGGVLLLGAAVGAYFYSRRRARNKKDNKDDNADAGTNKSIPAISASGSGVMKMMKMTKTLTL